ncbi:hypothetical protein [Actinomadura sp. SCN-SB]|uniref:hypothetical protein n=1 Tax=Actinomadura sp. SCN-SB TaxID=3373092 RepID=UPI003752FD4D
MAESQERDAPPERDLPTLKGLPRIEDLPEIRLSRIEVPDDGVPYEVGEPSERADASEAPARSLEDEIFAMASTVEVEDASRAEPPLLRLWQGPVQMPPPPVIGRAVAGFLTFLFVDAVMMYAPLMMSRRPSLLPQMVALLTLAFGLGGLLVWKVRGAWRPFGIGMMLGWLFLTLVSLGLLTGVSP